MKKFALVAAIGICVAACASHPYVPPPDGSPTATLVLRNTGGRPVGVWPYADAAQCKGQLDAPYIRPMGIGAEVQLDVQAQQDFSFGALWLCEGCKNARQSCSADATFRPEEGERYVALFDVDNFDCRIDVVRETSRGNTVDEPSFRQRERVQRFGDTAYCE